MWHHCLETIAVLLSILARGQTYEACRTSQYGDYKYCDYDCCGSWPNQYCCSDYTMAVWVIVVIVIGSVAVLVGIVVLVRRIYLRHRQNNNRIQVVQPTPATVSYTVPSAPQQPLHYGYQPQQPWANDNPVYQQPHHPLPAYGHNVPQLHHTLPNQLA